MSEIHFDNEKLMLSEISTGSVITREAERMLFMQYASAVGREKEKIKAKIVNANMRFVLSVALQYSKKMSIELGEFVSEGKIGLLIAIELFDYRKDVKFISFAVWHIKCRISKFLENNDLIRLPSHQKVKLNKAKKNSNYDDVDDNTRYLWDVTQPTTSFDAPITEDCVLGDIISDDRIEDFADKYFRDITINKIQIAISEILDPEEIVVLNNLYGFESNERHTLRSVSDIMGKSHERIRQIRDKAFNKLKKNVNFRNLKDMMY